jgi:hypothetical protein
MTSRTLPLLTPLLIALLIPPANASGKSSDTLAAADSARQSLLKIEKLAVAVENGADELRGARAASGASPESSLARLLTMKDEVNQVGDELKILEAERSSLPGWEQKALDRVFPLLQLTAANIQGAIEYLDTNRTHLWSAMSGTYADRIYNESKQVAATLQGYLKYESLRKQEQQLQHELNATRAELGL